MCLPRRQAGLAVWLGFFPGRHAGRPLSCLQRRQVFPPEAEWINFKITAIFSVQKLEKYLPFSSAGNN
jgi:hypothetical protein